MGLFKNIFASAIGMVAGLSIGAACAATASGVYTMNVYNYDSFGVPSNADALATNLNSATLVGSVVLTGFIDFLTTGSTTPTIKSFLDSSISAHAGTSYTASGDGNWLNKTLSVGGFTTTTLFDIYGTFASAVIGTVTHDDGTSLYQGNNTCIICSAAPTSEAISAFSANAGGFRMIYSAANGNPEILKMDVTAVPVPAAGSLLILALGGFGFFRRRKSAF